MADRTLQDQNTTLLTAIGGTLNASDDVYVGRFAVQYVDADLSADDINSIVLGPEFRGSFAAGAGGGQLKLVVNNTGAGFVKDASSASLVEIISTSAAGVIDELRYGTTNSHPVSINTCDMNDLYVFTPGTVTVQSACDLNNAYVTAGTVSIVYTASYSMSALYVGGTGQVTMDRDVANVYVQGGGYVRFNHTQVTPSGAVYMQGGTADFVRCGTCACLTGYSGLADFSKLVEPMTVSARSCGPGVTVRIAKNGVQPTFSSTAGDVGGGPFIDYV